MLPTVLYKKRTLIEDHEENKVITRIQIMSTMGFSHGNWEEGETSKALWLLPRALHLGGRGRITTILRLAWLT